MCSSFGMACTDQKSRGDLVQPVDRIKLSDLKLLFELIKKAGVAVIIMKANIFRFINDDEIRMLPDEGGWVVHCVYRFSCVVVIVPKGIGQWYYGPWNNHGHSHGYSNCLVSLLPWRLPCWYPAVGMVRAEL